MAVSLNSVWKTYGEGATAVHALAGVDAEIPSGEFTVILGPSGSGKTTMLNLIGGIDEVTSGDLFVEDLNLTGLSSDERTAYRRSTVGFVFQFFNLIPTLTALENVELVTNLTMGNGAERAAAVLEHVGLAERLDHFPAMLSGGEQQRVAIARALAKSPPVLLCDEPTGELDFETGRLILDLLRRVNREENQTVLLVTHNAAIGDMADRVLRLRSGSIVEDRHNANPIEGGELIW